VSRLGSRVAIVTGASRGVGRGEAVALSKEGATVVVVATSDAVYEVADEVAGLGGAALGLRCDVTDRDQVAEVVAETVERFGRVDILVNNAQRIPAPQPFEAWPIDEMRAVWASGFEGTWNFMQACHPHMKAQRHGRIVNTCSAVGYDNWPGFSAYAATKEAIRALTRTVAREWGELGITVNVIAPAVATDAMDELYPEGPAREQALAMVPMRRFGDAELDIGRAVVYLATDGGYVTGCTLSVDGGVAAVV